MIQQKKIVLGCPGQLNTLLQAYKRYGPSIWPFDKMYRNVIIPVVIHFGEGGTAMLKTNFGINNMMMCMCTRGSSPDLAGA